MNRFFALVWIGIASAAPLLPASMVVRGWLSDEGCARGRASSGVYSATNPDCARQCVAKGNKIVLIDPGRKEILVVDNQDAARPYVGDLVEVTGAVDAAGKLLHADAVKLIEKGVASCARKK